MSEATSHISSLKFIEAENDIIDQVLDYFYEDDDLATFFEEWCRAHAHLIDSKQTEHKLVYSSLHKDFLREFEDKLTEFIDSRGSSIDQVYNILRTCAVDSEHDVFVQVLNASCDYDVFIQMMRETAEVMETEKRNGKSNLN